MSLVPAENHRDHSFAIDLRVLPQHNRPRQFTIFRPAHFFFTAANCFLSVRWLTLRMLRQPRENLCRLRRGFPLSENHLGMPARSLDGVDFGKSQIFER